MPSGSPTDAFKTHAAYISAFASLVAPNIPLPIPALRSVAAAVGALPPPGTAAPNVAGALKSLTNAWQTELLLDQKSFALSDDDFARLANNWAVIQVYYVFYHCTQALAQAKGFARPQDHPTTQSLFYDYWAQRPIVLPPWTFAVGHDGPRNVPAGIKVDDSIHQWSGFSGEDCWSIAAKALRTTRQDAIKEALRRKRDEGKRLRGKEWDKAEGRRQSKGRAARARPSFSRPILKPVEKTAVSQQVRPHTVMDYLYRLRIRTNYEDSEMFTEGPDYDGASLAVRTNLRRLCGATLLVHELWLARLLGAGVLRSHADHFLTSTAPGGGHSSLRDRRQFL